LCIDAPALALVLLVACTLQDNVFKCISYVYKQSSKIGKSGVQKLKKAKMEVRLHFLEHPLVLLT